MARRTLHTAAALLGVALQLTVSVGVASSLVLCSSQDGHLAIESAFAGDCCSGHALPERGPSLRAPACDCIDTPLLRPALQGGAPRERMLRGASAAGAASVLLAAGPTPAWLPGASLRVGAPIAGPGPLAALRSVVLVV
jgi:hypothetical protein